MISARSLTKRYGPKTVVDDLSFDVKPGVGIGAIVRQPTAAIMIALIWTLVAEPIIGGLLPAVGRRLPLSSASNMTAIEPHHDFRARMTGGLYSAAIMLALVAVGAHRIATTDA